MDASDYFQLLTTKQWSWCLRIGPLERLIPTTPAGNQLMRFWITHHTQDKSPLSQQWAKKQFTQSAQTVEDISNGGQALESKVAKEIREYLEKSIQSWLRQVKLLIRLVSTTPWIRQRFRISTPAGTMKSACGLANNFLKMSLRTHCPGNTQENHYSN